ncbi:MAG TPA: outer membrane protein assembly factor BamE [Stellaceae bacterium]|nr:outer membrane protein assembly factor BamE [Stellaceae bacterium]
MTKLRLSSAAAVVSAAVGLAGVLAGCSATIEQRGNLPTVEEIAQIHPGKTTKQQVTQILGSPSSVSVFDDKDWYYISRRTSQVAFFDPSVLDQEVYIIDFNDDGVVRAVDHKTLRDAENIVPVARTTPAPGRKLTFLEQVIGNLGRFNGTGGEAGETGSSGRPPGPALNSEE